MPGTPSSRPPGASPPSASGSGLIPVSFKGGWYKLRSFEAATGRRFGARRPFGAIQAEVAAASTTVRARARHAYANHPYVRNGVEAWVSALVGAGIVPASKEFGPLWDRWTPNADADGRTDAYGLQAEAVRSLIVDGEAFILLRNDDEGFRLQLIPSEIVAEDLTTDDPKVVSGVEFNAQGKRVAYHVRTEPFVATKRLPAEDVIHLYRPLGVRQVRGISWLAPVLLTANEFDQLADALLVNSKIQALHVGFLIDQAGASGIPYEGDQLGNLLETGLEPGTLKVLPTGMALS